MELLRRLESEARERLPEPAYDHLACGAGDERTLADNELAWRRLWLRPRVLVPAADPDTRLELLGAELQAPVLLAPVGSVGLAHADGPVPALRAAASRGLGACVATRAALNFPHVAAAVTDGPTWFQLYVDRDTGRSEHVLAGLAATGYRAVVLTADLPVIGRRDRDRRHGTDWVPDALQLGAGGWEAALSWEHVAWAAGHSGLPVVVKGILAAEDAELAIDHGAAAVVVSNHGGRQVEGALPTAVALPEVAEAVGGRVPVLVDGGLRSGSDVFRALALGATAVLIGRPWLWGLAAGGEEGVGRVLDEYVEDLRTTMTLAGCRDLASIGGEHVRASAW